MSIRLSFPLAALAAVSAASVATSLDDPIPVVVVSAGSVVSAVGALPSERIGWTIALDGDTLAVGSLSDFGPGPAAVYVFTRSGGGWVQEARLVATGATHAYGFGSALALAGDILVVGARGEDLGGGAFYVFERIGGVWDAGRRFTRPGSTSVGAAVAIEGERIAVGAAGWPGEVLLVGRSGGTWAVDTVLVSPSAMGVGRFGAALVLEGGRLVVGAPQTSVGGVTTGLAFVFDFDGLAWQVSGTLQPSVLQAGMNFGNAVTLDGERVAVGAYGSGGFGELGSAYVYARGPGGWVGEARLESPSGASGDRFGHSVFLGGGRLFVGAPLAGFDARVLVYTPALGGWWRTHALVPVAPFPEGQLGFALCGSSEEVVASAPYSAPERSAYSFELQPPTETASFCVAEPNRTGATCHIGSLGSTSVALDDFVLFATGVPTLHAGIFLAAEASAQLPMASGWLCLSPFHPGIFRLPPPVVATATAVAARALDLGALPPGMQVVPGNTWYFQLWYRDLTLVGSNWSDGVRATFTP